MPVLPVAGKLSAVALQSGPDGIDLADRFAGSGTLGRGHGGCGRIRKQGSAAKMQVESAEEEIPSNCWMQHFLLGQGIHNRVCLVADEFVSRFPKQP